MDILHIIIIVIITTMIIGIHTHTIIIIGIVLTTIIIITMIIIGTNHTIRTIMRQAILFITDQWRHVQGDTNL